MTKELSHIKDGQAHMVNVENKHDSKRSACAEVKVLFPQEVWNELKERNFDHGKGSIVQTATLAGIMGAKKTSDLIPLCHPLAINYCQVQFEELTQGWKIETEVRITGKTGVEMEALTAASVAALTVYDMCKALGHKIEITDLRLISKSGGKSDYAYEAPENTTE